MSGACTGFLFHNRYRASIVMSRVGSFALGGAVAAIAACSGMFLPMLIACSLFFIELLFAILQVCDSVPSFSSIVWILKYVHASCYAASGYLLIASLEQILHFILQSLWTLAQNRCSLCDNGIKDVEWGCHKKVFLL